jgi:hypothetical protein
VSTRASEVFEGAFELAEPVVAGVAALECVAAVKAYWACGWSEADVKLEQGLGWPVALFLLKGNDFSIRVQVNSVVLFSSWRFEPGLTIASKI